LYFNSSLSTVRYKSISFSKRYYLSFLNYKNYYNVCGGQHVSFLEPYFNISTVLSVSERALRGEDIFSLGFVFPATAVSVFSATEFLEFNFFFLRWMKQFFVFYSPVYYRSYSRPLKIFISLSVWFKNLLGFFLFLKVVFDRLFIFIENTFLTPFYFIQFSGAFISRCSVFVVNFVIFLFFKFFSESFLLFKKIKRYFF
jgi:hypothetical protein